MSTIGTFVAGIVASAEASVVLPVIALCLMIAGLYWAFNGHEHGKSRATAALFGGALAIMANPIATAWQAGMPH